MTEAEWSTCTDSTPMLEFLTEKVSQRKLWLFGCACCRRIWHVLDEASRLAVEAGELYADGGTDYDQLLAASVDAHHSGEGAGDKVGRLGALACCLAVVDPARNGLPILTVPVAAGRTAKLAVRIISIFAQTTQDNSSEEGCFQPSLEKKVQAHLLREIIGNPYRSLPPDPLRCWQNASPFARMIYADRAFDRLPILADALEDAGCDNEDILAHCRSEGPHVKGCWVVDTVLGRE